MKPIRKRASRPVEGRHTRTARTPAHLGGDATTLMHLQGVDGGPGAVVPPEPLPARTSASVELREGGALLRTDEQPPADLLAQIRNGLRNLDVPPDATVYVYGPDGMQPAESDLRGRPTLTEAGLNVGRVGSDGDLVFRVDRTEWLDDLIEAAEQRIRELHARRRDGAA